jgi:6-phosphofructokinase 2
MTVDDQHPARPATTAPRIVTLTINPTVDIGLDVESLDPTGKNRATVRGVAPGGGGINVARAVIELGGSALALHTAGAEVGSRLSRLLDEEGIEHVAVEVAGETREAVVLDESSTERSFHIVPPGSELTGAEVDDVIAAVLEHANGHDIVVVSGSLPPGVPVDFHGRLAAALGEDDRRLLLDPSGADLPPAPVHAANVLRVNRREAGRLVGAEVSSFSDALFANQHILDRRWADIAVTTVGEYGAVISTESGHVELRTPELPRPARSDAGAGDSFMAGLAWGLAQGLDVADAGALAVAAASATVMTPGTELCRRSDVDRLLPDVGVVRHDEREPDAVLGPP